MPDAPEMMNTSHPINLDSLQFRHLQRFLAIADHGSLSAAARALGMTQQALGMNLSSLEDVVGVPLFERSPGGTTKPTRFGEAFIRYAQSQLAGMTAAITDMRALAEATSGTVRLGVGEAFDTALVAKAVAEFHQTRPSVRIVLQEDYTENLLDMMSRGELDFVCGNAATLDQPEGIESTVLGQRKDVVVARPEHPLAQKKDLILADLTPYTWLVPHRRASDQAAIAAAFAAEGLTAPTQMIYTDAYGVGLRLMLENDFLIMTTPAMADIARNGDQAALVRLDIDRPTVIRITGVMRVSGRIMPPTADALAAAIINRTPD